MSDNEDRPLVTRFIQSSPNEYKRIKAGKWEYQIVSRLLTFYGLARYRRDIERHEFESSTNYRLSLPAFHALFPEVPFYLVAHVPTHLDTDLTLARVMSRFDKTQLLTMYDKFVDLVPLELGAGMPYGLVIPWPHVRDGLILHDMAIDMNNAGSCVLFSQEERCLTLESFDRFLSHQSRTLYGREE